MKSTTLRSRLVINLPVVGSISRRGTTGREGTSDRVEIGLRESGRPGAEKVEV